MSSHPVERLVLARWPRGAGTAISLNGQASSPPDQTSPSVPRGSHLRFDVETGVVVDASRHQPVEVTEAGLGVGDDLRLVGLGSARGKQVARHVVDRVLEPAGNLDRRASAEVHDSLRQRGGPSRPRGSLGHEHLGADLPGGVGDAGARRTETGYKDVGLHVERVDVGQVERPHSFVQFNRSFAGGLPSSSQAAVYESQ